MTTQDCKYKIRNWSKYNAALKARGSLTIWVDEDSCSDWYNGQKTGKPGASQIYTDTAVQCCLTVREVFRLPLRQTEGFMNSVFRLGQLDLNCPDYTTLSLRGTSLAVVCRRSGSKKPRHVVIDSTGLKVYGEGEWKVRVHGIGKRRTWRKLHLAMDADSQEVIAVQVTGNSVGDSEVLPDLHLPDGSVHPRTAILREINETDRATWKKNSGYHERSLAETAMSRMKQIFGGNLKNRLFDNQITEGYIRVAALNVMTALKMPDSIKIV